MACARAMHYIAWTFQFVAILGCLTSSIYYLVCLYSAIAFLRQRDADRSARAAQFSPPVSILKPLKGTDPEIYESFRSHCLQDYPEYEIIFGVSDPADPAVASVEQLQQEFPDVAIRLMVCTEILGPNVKVSNLEQMVQTAQYQHLVVNDSDIRVESDYLQRVMAPLGDERLGMVTCLYRGVAAGTLGSRLEALGISTDFCPGVLVAQRLESGLHFGLGSTMAFRRHDLERIGGFKALVDFLADDYELGRRIAGLNKKVLLSDVVVETHLPEYDLPAFLEHQVRWFRGIRDARRKGYIGLISTFGVMWALLGLLASGAAPWSWAVLGSVVLLRIAVALVICRAVLQDEDAVEQLWLLPMRDLIAAGVWIASFTGHTVTWRGDRFELKNGRLIRIAP
jgi:ceramide glucosyltransferase